MTIITKNPINSGGALIAYEQKLATASLPTGTASNGSVDKALIKNTYERFRPDAGSVVAKFQTSANADINYVAIGAHILKGQTVTVSYATSVGGALTDIETIPFASNEPVLIVFDTITVREIALTFTASGSPELGVIYAGAYLEMPRSIYGGHSPITLNPNTEYQSNVSESGQFLGRSITRQGVNASYSWRYLKPEFVRGEFSVFLENARKYPFFISWRHDLFEDVAFVQTNSDPQIANMSGGHGLMQAQLSVRGHRDVV